MGVCVLDVRGYCERHQEVHVGRRVALSQDPSEHGEKARKLWDDLLAGKHAPAAVGGTVIVRQRISGGPGTELGEILKGIGVVEKPNCGCKAMMRQMDEWSVSGTRTHAAQVAMFIRAGAKKFGWVECLAALGNATLTGLAFKINWFDPWPDLIEMACCRAEAKLAGLVVEPVTIGSPPNPSKAP